MRFNNYRDSINEIEGARILGEEGREEGKQLVIEERKQLGIEQGKQLGIEEGKKKSNLEIAQKAWGSGGDGQGLDR